MCKPIAVHFFVLLDAAFDEEQEIVITRGPWRGVDVAVDEDVLQWGEYLFGFGVISVSKLVVNEVLKLIFVFDHLLDIISEVNGVFEYFFELVVICLEPSSAL